MFDNALFDFAKNELSIRHRDKFNLCTDIHTYFQSFEKTLADSESFKSNRVTLCIYTGIVLSQIETTYIPIVKLAAEGHVSDCYSLLRTIIELRLKLTYMAAEPDERSEQLESYFLIERIRLLQKAPSIGQVGLRSEVEMMVKDQSAIVDEFTRNKKQVHSNVHPFDRDYYWDWTKDENLIKWISRLDPSKDRNKLLIQDETKRNYLRSAYEFSCEYVHPKIGTLLMHMKIGPQNENIEFRLNNQPTDKDMDILLFSITFFILDLVEFLAAVHSISLPEKHWSLTSERRSIFTMEEGSSHGS